MRRFFQKLGGQKANYVPDLPEGVRIYVVGDVHGRFDLLCALQDKISADASGAARIIEIYLGDYIDRGPQSREVIDLLIGLTRDRRERIFLKGNHEETLLKFLNDPQILASWRQFGGVETLHSYGVDLSVLRDEQGYEQIQKEFAARFSASHRGFFQSLQTSATIGGYFFVHAGVRPGVPLEEQKEEDLMWIRQDFLESRANHGKVIVHGHTPVEQPEIWPNRINIDTGAYLSNKLTCLVLEGQEKRVL